MSTWQEDPELFLHKSQQNGSQLHIWRCERKLWSRSLLRREDFTDEIPVPNFRYLVKKGFEWSKSYMEKLEKEISRWEILVNCEGLMYVELFKFSENFYLRLHDVLYMDYYGFKNPKIPFRTVEYLGLQRDGQATILVDPSPNELKLSAELNTRTSEVATLMNNLDQEMRNKRILEEQVANVESKYKILAENEKKLNANLEARGKEVATLQQDLKKEKDQRQGLEKRVDSLQATVKAILASTKKNQSKGGNGTKTTTSDDLDHWTCVVEPLQLELNQANDDKRALGEQVADLESKNKTLTTNQTKLKEALDAKNKELTGLQKDLEKEKSDKKALEKVIAGLEAQVKELQEEASGSDDDDDDDEEEIEKEEAWMSDYIGDNWVGFEELQVKFERSKPALRITKEGAIFRDDNTTNVKANNFCLVFSGNTKYPAKVVDAKELTPNGEKARYDPNVWGLLINAGAKYAATYDDAGPSLATCAF